MGEKRERRGKTGSDPPRFLYPVQRRALKSTVSIDLIFRISDVKRHRERVSRIFSLPEIFIRSAPQFNLHPPHLSPVPLSIGVASFFFP